MHRGSSKGSGDPPPVPETLPLSAPSSSTVELEVVLAGRTVVRTVEVPPGAPVRQALRAIGELPEGCAVFRGERSVPLDTPVERGERLRVVPTFSGG